MQMVVTQSKAVSLTGTATQSLGAGASYTPPTDQIILGFVGDNVAGAIQAECTLDDLVTWVAQEDPAGNALDTSAPDQPVGISSLGGGSYFRLTSTAGATKVLAYYYWELA